MKIVRKKRLFQEGQHVRIKDFDTILPRLLKHSTCDGDYYTKDHVWIPSKMINSFGKTGIINDIKTNGNLSIKVDNILWLFEQWMVE